MYYSYRIENSMYIYLWTRDGRVSTKIDRTLSRPIRRLQALFLSLLLLSRFPSFWRISFRRQSTTWSLHGTCLVTYSRSLGELATVSYHLLTISTSLTKLMMSVSRVLQVVLFVAILDVSLPWLGAQP